MVITAGIPPQEVNVFIPQDAKTIGVLLSGGADSAILLWMLAQEAKSQSVKIFTFTIPRPDNAVEHSHRITTALCNMGLNVPLPLIVGSGQVHHSEQTRSGHRQIIEQWPEVDYIYYASQTIPAELQDIPGVHYPERPTALYYPGKTICPFYNLTKIHTLDLYYKLGVESLLEYSHSCCAWSKGRCNRCYNCLERAWAFTSLGKTDPGVL